jgi:hypothetical protein
MGEPELQKEFESIEHDTEEPKQHAKHGKKHAHPPAKEEHSDDDERGKDDEKEEEREEEE